MFEQTFKNIDDILHKDAGCSSELDYVEQTSWILFLKYLDDLEKDKKTAAELSGKTYNPIISPEFRWEKWASPKNKEGKLDFQIALTGDDLADFVNGKLFPYLKKFKADAVSADTIEYKIGEIFSELKNRIQSGYNLREVLNRIDELRFRTHSEKHEMSHLYEGKIQNMGNAGRNGGEYYTPRPLIRTIVKVVSPQIGNKIYDGAVGSAGFLCEAFEYLKTTKSLTTKDTNTLQKNSFYGKEKKALAYIIGVMNMILHGIEAPNIVHANTLAENITDIQEKDRYDIVLANPPFGGKERAEVQQNFPIKTGETAFLFLQHFIKILKAGGKAGIVIKSTFLSNTDLASVSLRKLLFESCNLHTILDLPGGVFTGAGVKTVVLFFEKGTPTRNIWYYQLNLNHAIGKTTALSENDLEDFVDLQKTKANSENSWTVNAGAVDLKTYDLFTNNPNKIEKIKLREPQKILNEIKDLVEDFTEIYKLNFKTVLKGDYERRKLGDVLDILRNGVNCKQDKKGTGDKISRIESISNAYFDINKVGYAKLSDADKKKYRLIKGDILFSHINSPIHVGKTAIFDTEEEVYHGVNLLLMRPKPFVDVNYFEHYLKFLFQSGYWKGLCKQSVNQASVNQQDINKVDIIYPKSLAEQQHIVTILDDTFVVISIARANVEKTINNLDELKKSLLQTSFHIENNS
jgi:type I restriction enzyme M protein